MRIYVGHHYRNSGTIQGFNRNSTHHIKDIVRFRYSVCKKNLDSNS